ncbi:hypothetical protein BS17DRAFT_807426 [Gyrodon lividus]|nr:hypothetical protein BS17DRAFT_807426 [Gyrodon lividus]
MSNYLENPPEAHLALLLKHNDPLGVFPEPDCDALGNAIEGSTLALSPEDVIKSGQAHGAQPEDIYGCLYFYLSDQLRTFAKRIRELHITFYVSSTDPRILAKDISSGQYLMYGLPPSTRFNRIDVANTLDADHVGVQDVLRSWGPLLAQGDTAAIIGVLLNWSEIQKDGSATGAGEVVIVRIVGSLTKAVRIPPGTTATTAIFMAVRELDAMYDNPKLPPISWQPRASEASFARRN